MALVAGGRLYNLLSSAAEVLSPTCSPAESALQPFAAAYDGKSNQLALFGSAAVKPCIQFDLNHLADGDGENASVAAWLGTGGTLTAATDQFNSGAASVKLAHTSAASRTQTILRRAGEPFALAVALRGDGTATTSLYVQNKQSGMWFASDGTWSASQVAFASRSAASWSTPTPVVGVIESQTACGADVVALRFTLSLSASGSGWLDDLAYVPGYNTVAAAGHNIPTSSAFPLRCSSFATLPAGADPSATATASCTPVRPTCYATFSATRYERWVRFYLGYSADVPPDPTGAGELVLTYATDLTQGHNWAFGWNRNDASKVVMEGPDGHRYAQERGSEQTRELVAKYEPQSQSDYDALVMELYRRCRAEVYPVLWVPSDFDASGTAILGQLVGESLSTVGAFLSIWQLELRVKEMPFPVGFIP